MENIRFITDGTSRVWNYVLEIRFDDKLEELETLTNQLKNQRDAVMSSVDANEGSRTHAIEVWLKDSDILGSGATDVVKEGSILLGRSCLGAWCPCSCWNARIFRNRVINKISLIKDLMPRGNFGVLAESSRGLLRVHALQESPNLVGLESTLNTACGALQEAGCGIIALCGMGRVGKTALLTKINNKFLDSEFCSEFGVVIWVEIPKDLNIDRIPGCIQGCIGARLGLSWADGNVDMRSRARHLFHVLSTKKFVLLLDDIRVRLDLNSIGIPPPTPENQSKVLFTTRSMIVCREMETDKNIEVECLNCDDAWDLFQSKLEKDSIVFRDQEIQKVAKAVAQKCGGHPQALIVTRRAMASESTLADWKRALRSLEKNAAEFTGMRNDLFPVLKSSYDDLIDEAHKRCFLFCSLYPENYEIEIESLVRQCIGLGYIRGFDEWEEAVDTCQSIIGDLKDSFLLESSTNQDGSKVKMHNVHRYLAHWIANETDKYKILVNTGLGVVEANRTRKWKTARVISLTGTQITELNDIPDCPYLETFLLTDNAYLHHIHEDFFLHMPGLKSLDLSWSLIENLPRSIGKLDQLEYLNVSHTGIKKLPDEMKYLIKLRYLFLLGIPKLCKISVGVIKHLVNLEVLHLDVKSFGDGEGDLLLVQELGCLKKLISLKIKISNVEIL